MKKETNHLSSMLASGLYVCLSVHRQPSVLPVGGFLFVDSKVVVFPLFLMEALCVNRTLLLAQSRNIFFSGYRFSDSFVNMKLFTVKQNALV